MLGRMQGRGVLHVELDVPGVGRVDIFNTHFGIDDVEQCHSVVDLLAIVNDETLDPDAPQVSLYSLAVRPVMGC